ncbi:TIM29 translocase, partial [Alcedo cyanopectus]|nr:TIM29 translocase [Ceyx cyanopectus]
LAVIYEDAEACGLALYPARCPQLRPGWRELAGLVWDVGWCGRWWVLSSRLRDCDVNEGEFRALPERLRRVGPWQLRSQR